MTVGSGISPDTKMARHTDIDSMDLFSFIETLQDIAAS